MSPEAALDALAASVADGQPLDWRRLEAEAAPRERRLIRHLRLVENISSLYRSIADFEETVVDGTPEGPRWGRLVLLDRIGAGTSCEVHRAFDTDLHRHVALKLLHADGPATRAAHDRILQEARRLARVRHRNVVQVFGAEQHLERVGLWMELVEGESLDQIVRTRGAFGAREAAGIGQDVCAALAAVHAAGLLHRDVKAQNVLRESGGRIVVMDFGTGEERTPVGGTARLVGTPLYLAPEILDGQPASIASDIYSVGVLLFYLVTGGFPTASATMEQLREAHRAAGLRHLRDVRPDLPAAFISVVDRALARAPEARYQTAGELEVALRDLSDGGQDQSATMATPRPLSAPAPSSTWRVAIIVAIVAMLLVIAGLLTWTRLVHPPALVSGTPIRIAVLPLQAASGSASSALADALTDQLIDTLGGLSALRVTAPSSSARFKGSTAPTDDIAKQLGVDIVVTGTVVPEKTGPNEPVRARVDTRVTKAGVATPLWSGPTEWVAGDTAGLRAGLARVIAGAVSAVVTTREASRLGQRGTLNPSAEEAYFRGRSELTAYGPEGARRALDLFAQAIRYDPSFAAPHAWKSRAYVVLGQFGLISEGDSRQSALSEAREALRLDDESADAHRAMADLTFFYDWDWAGAEREYLRALELNPSLARARLTYAELLAAIGRFQDALAQSELARSLDAKSPEVITSRAVVQLYAHMFDDARASLDQALKEQPGSAGALIAKARVEAAQERYPEALADVNRALALTSGGVPVEITRIQLLARNGESDEARTALKALEGRAAAGEVRVSHRDRAYVRLALGEVDAACDELEHAYAERESALRWIGVDPRLDELRANPRFTVILTRMGLH